jgi:hypothetical protein
MRLFVITLFTGLVAMTGSAWAATAIFSGKDYLALPSSMKSAHADGLYQGLVMADVIDDVFPRDEARRFRDCLFRKNGAEFRRLFENFLRTYPQYQGRKCSTRSLLSSCGHAI